MSRRRAVIRPAAVLLAGPSLLLPLAGGCTPYRIEHRTRPAYYAGLVDEPLPDRVVLKDGTVVLYDTVDSSAESTARLAAQEAAGGKEKDGAGNGTSKEETKTFQIREENDDGTVTLRAFLPEHVVTNLLNCLRLEEYELIWDQLLSETTRREYEAEGHDAADFAAYCRRNRLELAKMLARMRLGFATHRTVVENVAPGVIECRMWPDVAKLFRFRSVRMIREGYGLKLLVIR